MASIERRNDSGKEPLLEGTSTRSSEYLEKPSDERWQEYPFNLESYSPFTEWGEHYRQIFHRDFWPIQSALVLQDMTGTSISTYPV